MHHELVLYTILIDWSFVHVSCSHRIGTFNIHLVRIGPLKVHIHCIHMAKNRAIFTTTCVRHYVHMHSHNLYLASEQACHKAFLFGIILALLLIILYVSPTNLCGLCTTCRQSLFAHTADTEYKNLPSCWFTHPVCGMHSVNEPLPFLSVQYLHIHIHTHNTFALGLLHMWQNITTLSNNDVTPTCIRV